MEISVPQSVEKLASLSKSPVYITGGFVRNQIVGLKESDIDLCGPVAANALMLPPQYIIKTVNYRLGTAVIKCGKDEFEYTPFRTENYLEGGNHTPSDIAFTTDIKQDVLRRDFTVNSIYYDVKNKKLIDLCGGIKDAQNKILRAKDPLFTFSSDGLRLMRLVRIAAQTGFKIEAATADAAMKNAHLLRDISPERKREELLQILSADLAYGEKNAHYRGLKLLHRLGLIKYIIPQLLEGEGVLQPVQFHKYDVLEHLFQTVKFADPSVRLAALLHDIGKPYCQRKFSNMHGHDKASEIIAREVLGPFGLRFSNETTDSTARLVGHHMYDYDSKTSKGKLKLFVAKNFDIIDRLVLLKQADALGSGMTDLPPQIRMTDIKEELLCENAPVKLSDLNINGTTLMDLGFRGEKIGDLLEEMLEICVLESRLNNYEWLYDFAKNRLVKRQV